MPVKNAGDFLSPCIESILNQTYSSWELIAVNDHSDDQSYETLCTFSKTDERISVYNSPGKGIIDALKFGYAQSKGEYITRMDADDLMVETKLVLMSQALQTSPSNVAVGSVKYISEKTLGDGYLQYENWLNQLTASKANFDELYRECSIPSPCWMMSRIDFEKCGGFDNNTYPEDYDLAFRMYGSGMKVIGVNETCHIWRDYESRSSRTDPNYSDNRFIHLKASYFIELDYDDQKTLILWGAGKKGKKIAQELSNKHIPFRWICNSENKIGKDIYGIRLESSENFAFDHERMQVIHCVGNPNEKHSIEKQLRDLGFNLAIGYFPFC